MSEAQSSYDVAGIPNGRAAAAILAAGAGSAAVGVLAILRDAFAPIAAALNFYNPSGPLSGVTTVVVVIWLVAWIILARRWRNENVDLGKINIAAFGLLAMGTAADVSAVHGFAAREVSALAQQRSKIEYAIRAARRCERAARSGKLKVMI